MHAATCEATVPRYALFCMRDGQRLRRFDGTDLELLRRQGKRYDYWEIQDMSGTHVAGVDRRRVDRGHVPDRRGSHGY